MLPAAWAPSASDQYAFAFCHAFSVEVFPLSHADGGRSTGSSSPRSESHKWVFVTSAPPNHEYA